MSAAMTSIFGSGFVSYSSFHKIDLSFGQITEACENVSAKVAAYMIQLKFSPKLMEEHTALTKKPIYTSSAQLTVNHTAAELKDQQVLCTINFPRKQIGKVMSDCLVTGVQTPIGTHEEKRLTTIYMKPSSPVSLGSKVSILAEDEIIETNSRDLTWDEFASQDLRIGTIKTIDIIDSPFKTHFSKIKCTVDFGETGTTPCIGIFKKEIDPAFLENKQVLILTNLNPGEASDIFELSKEESISSALCTVGGAVVVEPAKPVSNGFRLA